MPYIIGTAGHIDHGKTTLIKALTGQDTDRLKEEKERGISIDLGFAHLALPDGSEAGIVDVPGHERFIRNMLAGAHGIDLVLFTVAADDGVMPQTEEHLDIVHLLGVRTALFVITKVDLVSEARVREVEEEIEILTFETALEGSPVVHFSAVSEAGLEDVRTRIFDLLQGIDRPAPSGFFRLPVDRVFVLQGHGVIITGTALAGEVRTGEHVHAVPGGQKFRVRSIQVHGQSVEAAGWGQRVALNLTGQERGALERGHMICHEELTLVSTRFDAHLEVRPAATKGIRNHQRVRIHLGTAERMGKLIFLGDTEKVEPKDTTYCQVLLTEPLLVMRGDHFIVRDETARRTLGGGEIVEPRAPRHRRREKDIEQRLRTLHHGDTPEMIRSFLDGDTSLATSVDSICQFLNLKREETRTWLERTEGLRSFDSETGARVHDRREVERLPGAAPLEPEGVPPKPSAGAGHGPGRGSGAARRQRIGEAVPGPHRPFGVRGRLRPGRQPRPPAGPPGGTRCAGEIALRRDHGRAGQDAPRPALPQGDREGPGGPAPPAQRGHPGHGTAGGDRPGDHRAVLPQGFH